MLHHALTLEECIRTKPLTLAQDKLTLTKLVAHALDILCFDTYHADNDVRFISLLIYKLLQRIVIYFHKLQFKVVVVKENR